MGNARSYPGIKEQSELMVITKAKDLCNYVLTVTQKSPKQFRFSLVGRMQNLSLSIVENLIRANDIVIGQAAPEHNTANRYSYQCAAMTDLKLLAYLAELSVAHTCLLMKQYEQIARLSTDCRNLLGAWITSDRRRQSPMRA